MKTILKASLTIILLIVFLISFFVLYLTINEYKPKPIETIAPLSKGTNLKQVPLDTPLSLITWNIGYASLDEKTDFVMDGGTMSTARNSQAVKDNMEFIKNYLTSHKSDIIFLQEVDNNSKRSFKYNQIEYFTKALPQYATYHASNFNAVFVPFPFPQMMGKTYSGLFTASSFLETSAKRYQLPGTFSWPLRVANLKRCIFVLELPTTQEGKKLYAINLHLSAYDSGGFLRTQELDFVKDYMSTRYNEGNYVIVGGDWNSLFPDIDIRHFPNYTTSEKNLEWVQRIPDNFISDDWTWVYDTTKPTVRSLEKAYNKGENFTGIIDGFLLSPNIILNTVTTPDMNFVSTDHQPVLCTIILE